MIRLRLPLGRPAFASFLFLAYPLAILAARSQERTWLLGRCIHLYHTWGRGLKVFTHPGCLSADLLEVCDAGFPGLHQRALSPSPADPLPHLRQLLHEGIYPQVDVDLCALGLSEPPGPWLHEVLLCGVEADRFELFAYDRTGRLRRTWIESERLVRALQIDGRELLHVAIQEGRRLPDWLIRDLSQRPVWICRQPIHGPGRLPEPEHVLEQLSIYLAGAVPRSDLGDGGRTLRQWGVPAQYALMDSIRQQHRVPLICLRLWWEHKRLMSQRLQWLATCGFAPPERVTAMVKLAAGAQQVRLHAVRHQRRATGARDVGDPSSTASLATRMEELIDREVELLRQLVMEA